MTQLDQPAFDEICKVLEMKYLIIVSCGSGSIQIGEQKRFVRSDSKKLCRLGWTAFHLLYIISF
jgi:hypothetical protein